jgi:hypothetical protein
MQLRRKRFERSETVLVLLPPRIRGFGGIFRKHGTASMLWGQNVRALHEGCGLSSFPPFSLSKTPVADGPFPTTEIQEVLF